MRKWFTGFDLTGRLTGLVARLQALPRRVVIGAGLGTLAIVLIVAAESFYQASAKSKTRKGNVAVVPAKENRPLAAAAATPGQEPAVRSVRSGTSSDPIVITDCRLAVVDKQDVPSQRDGVLLFVGTDIFDGRLPLLLLPHGLGAILLTTEAAAGEELNRIVAVRIGNDVKKVRRWREGDVVAAGQLLAQLDDRLARDDWIIKRSKIAAAQADLAAAERTRDEARSRYTVQAKLRSSSAGAASEEDVSAAKLNWDKYHYEAINKREALSLAESELRQAETVLSLHQIRSAIPGVLKTIYKQQGEAVRSLEPVVQVHGLSRLRAEGLVDEQHARNLRLGMRVVIEPSRSESPRRVLVGHLQEITGVAVLKDRSWIVSASEDGTVRVWDPSDGRERRVLPHSSPVRAVACSPKTKANFCLTGTADGKVRLWDLDSPADSPVQEVAGHRGAVTCVAFHPDGRQYVTGGDDRDILLWDASNGQQLYKFPSGHRGAVTSLQFTPHGQLVSVGRDNTLRLWTVGDRDATLETTLDSRSGEVTHLGVSPDGRRVLFDQEQSLRILSLPQGKIAGSLRHASGAANFTNFALFSPDGRLILTTSDGQVHIWRAPTEKSRGYEIRHLIAPDGSTATCAAFAPNGAFVATGSRDRQVQLWPVPAQEEIEQQLSAEVTLLEESLDSSTRQVRIWAELPNRGVRLLPGGIVTMAIGE